MHLTPEQRQAAQLQTAQWRELTGLSQQRMALVVGVGHSTYRAWETSKDPNAGPSKVQVRQLDGALQRLLDSRYRQGHAVEMWGWVDDDRLSYPTVTAVLRSCGFLVPSAAATPDVMIWVHRLREPNIVHGVLSLAAAAASRAGVATRLILDDVSLPSGSRQDLLAEFSSRVRAWFTFAGATSASLSISLYSEILTADLLAARGWDTVENYLQSAGPTLDLLLASKIVSPLQYSTDAEQSVLELVQRGNESLRSARLLTPLRNWLVFDAELASMTEDAKRSAVTLGAGDERVMWELWHRGRKDQVSGRVQHIFLQPAPLPSYRVPWQESALTARTTKPLLSTYLRNRTLYDGNTDLLEWFARSAVQLPAELNPQFRDSVDPALLEPDVAERMTTDAMASAIAQAVCAWTSEA